MRIMLFFLPANSHCENTTKDSTQDASYVAQMWMGQCWPVVGVRCNYFSSPTPFSALELFEAVQMSANYFKLEQTQIIKHEIIVVNEKERENINIEAEYIWLWKYWHMENIWYLVWLNVRKWNERGSKEGISSSCVAVPTTYWYTTQFYYPIENERQRRRNRQWMATL